MDSLNISKSSEELRKLILENPELPIVVSVGKEVVVDNEFYYFIAPSVTFSVGEYLDVDTFVTEYDAGNSIIYSRDELREKLQYYMEDDEKYEDMSDAEFDLALDEEVKKYEPYWKKVIFICADI